MDTPKFGKQVKTNEMGDSRVWENWRGWKIGVEDHRGNSGCRKISSSLRAENDRNKKVNEIARALVGLVTEKKETVSLPPDSRHEFEAAKLEQEMCRRCVESRISVESAYQQCTTGESLEHQ